MPAPITLTEQPAARTNRDGLNFISTTTPLPPRKDSNDDLIHAGSTLV